MYFWIKSLHLLFVIAWLATVFYLPRLLVNLAEAGDEPAVRTRLLLMGRRLYRFGHNMFGIALVLGIVLWQGWRILPDQLPAIASQGTWLHLKLTLVALVLAYFIWMGRWLKSVAADASLPTPGRLRLLNELPVPLLLVIIWLALAKPF